MLPTRRQLPGNDFTQMPQDGTRKSEQLVARGRVDSGVDFHDAGTPVGASRDGFDGDEEPSASDVERQRAYSDWLSGFEPRQQRTGEGQDGVGLVAHQVHPRSGEHAA